MRKLAKLFDAGIINEDGEPIQGSQNELKQIQNQSR